MLINRYLTCSLLLIVWSMNIPLALGHFQVIKPTNVIVTPENRKLKLDLLFTHPMENGPIMEMASPSQFGVMIASDKQDLIPRLVTKKISGKSTYSMFYTFEKPGDYIFYVEPAPYWEPAEEKFIIHYTKVIINAFGDENGWDRMVGFPIEIEPLVRPYGLWSGNIFRGIVKKDGKPVPYAEIEVEYYNENGKVTIPADPFITQVIKADDRGGFSYAMPKAGFWGFAALIESDRRMKSPAGEMVPIELGGLIWIKVEDMK